MAWEEVNPRTSAGTRPKGKGKPKDLGREPGIRETLEPSLCYFFPSPSLSRYLHHLRTGQAGREAPCGIGAGCMHTHLLSLHPAPLSHVECCTSHACRRLHTNSLHPRDTSACVEEGSSAYWLVVHTYANTLESCSLLCCQIGIAVEWTRQPACGLPRLGVSAVYVYSASPSHPSHPITSHARLSHVVGT
jgi:hypothetical protein